METVLGPQPHTLFIGLCFTGGQVRVIGAVPCCLKHVAQITKKKKLCLSLEWRGESNLFNIHAVHAKSALLPSNP